MIVLAAQAFRLVIVPDLTRASAAGRLTAEFVSYASALLAIAVPASVVAIVFSHQTRRPAHRQPAALGRFDRIACDLWLVPAAFAQTLAALCASALAARNSYLVAAAGYAFGAVAGLIVFISLASAHGLVSLAWGLALNGALAAGIPLVALVSPAISAAAAAAASPSGRVCGSSCRQRLCRWRSRVST